MSVELPSTTARIPRPTLTLPNLTNGLLFADTSFEGSTITVQLKGTADTEGKSELGTLLHAVHEEALRLAAAKVVIDFCKLEFMNSVCFKAFVTWVTRLRELAENQRYRIRFVSDSAVHWQRRSLAALSRFAADVLIES